MPRKELISTDAIPQGEDASTLESNYAGILRATMAAEHHMRMKAEDRVRLLEARIARCIQILSGVEDDE